ncbi:MAG: hypothetical protein JNL50_13460, partial [Phycisphaerae bacterium]|nr:hypothetical protein [Phycisphaerae bacterium]
MPVASLRTRTLCFSAAALVLLAGQARADLPPALDRAPANIPVVVAVRNADKFVTSLDSLIKLVSPKADAEGGPELGQIRAALAYDGVKKDGSFAFAVTSMPKPPAADAGMVEQEQPDAVVLIPVSDVAAFIKGMGGEGAKGVVELKGPKDAQDWQGPAFAKDLGGGYVAMGKDKDAVEKFDGKTGNLAAHKASLGAQGNKLADNADVIVIANIPLLQDQIKAGLDQGMQQMQMGLMMAGGGVAEGQDPTKSMKEAVEGYMRDATVGIMGVGIDEGGIWLDFGSQFKEGSEWAGICQGKGKPGALMAALPNQPFLFAVAADTSSAGVRSLLKKFAAAAPQGDQAPGMMDNMMAMLDKINGTSMMIGATPSIMGGGLFANTVQYISTTDAAGYTGAMKKSFEEMNGKTIAGTTFQSKFEPAAVDIAGAKVDRWSMLMQADPNSPQGAQMQQMSMMLYGMGGGPAGFMGAVDNGVVMTFANNTPLMTMAMDAAKKKNGASEDAGLKAVGARLPADRHVEMYLGTKSLIETVNGFMAMMGGGATYTPPADLPPIGMGAAMDNGGIQFRTFVPTGVFKAAGEMVKAMEAAQQGEMGEEGDAPADNGK